MLAKSMISRNFLGFANKKTRVFKYTNESRKKYDAPDIRIRRPGLRSPVWDFIWFSVASCLDQNLQGASLLMDRSLREVPS